jgi:hypothetical protein
MRVLAFTPTYGDGPREETLESVRRQTWAGQLDHELSWENPYPAPDGHNILVQYRRGRELALEGKYDALLTVEHDMWLPERALELLWATGSPVTYGVYLFRHGRDMLNAWEYRPGLIPDGKMGLQLSLNRDRSKLAKAQRAGMAEVCGVGLGCTLIRRFVLRRIPFRGGADDTEAPDVPFAQDCLQAGITQTASFRVLCGHWNGKRWLMPLGSVEMGDAIRVRSRKNITIRVGGGFKEMIAGEEYELPANEVPHLVRVGHVAPVA